MAARICASVFVLPLYGKQPATSSRLASGKRRAGRSRIPPPVSSTVNSVPSAHAWEARMPLGRTICPLVESRVVSIGKTPVRLSHIPLLPIAPGQFHIHPQIPVQIRLRAVEIEIADGDAAQVAAYLGVDGFAHDAVHAGEGADVDDSRGALLGQIQI